VKKDDRLEAIKTIKPVAEKCGVTDEELNDLLALEKEKKEVVSLLRELTRDYYDRLHLLVSQKLGW